MNTDCVHRRTLIMSFYLLLSHMIVGFHQQNTHTIAKRANIETCVGQFDVINDMIIITDESLKLGGKFLDRTDGVTREECLHFCCETDECDVFVYDECNIQNELCTRTCFAFHCGSSLDFHCKFTKKANYTIAVQSKKVAQPTLPPRPTLSQHELELKNLKSKLVNGNESINGAAAHANAVTTTTAKSVAMPAKSSSNVCGHYQFQCHSGECIAVYNVCDSIPQCVDGSDEGPECQSVARPTESSLTKAIEGRVKLYSTMNQNAMNAQKSLSEFVSHNREDPMTAPQWATMNQAAVVSHSNDMSGHIFNHKGGLHISNTIPQQQQLPMQSHQIPAFQLPPYNLQQQQALVQDGYIKAPTMENARPMWQQMPQFPMKPMESTQQNVAQQNMPYNWPIISPNLPVYSDSKTNNNEETLPKQDMIQTFEDTAVADKKKNGKNTIPNTIEAASISGEDKDSEYDDDEEIKPTEPPPKKKIHKHRKVLKTASSDATAGANDNDNVEKKANKPKDDSAPQQLKVVHSKLQLEFFDHDGDSEKPSGAVLSLTLGMLITMVLIVLVGCRATVVRKRVRRGGKAPYAHDADFLVNGMYL